MTWLQNGCCVRVIATGEVGTRLPLLGDAHVHLGLIDPTLLLAGGIGRVQDLGWIPGVAGGWRARSLAGAAGASAGTSARGKEAPLEIWIAGAFLTAPGGYPSDRSWALAGAVREVSSPADAEAAVAEQVAVGASVIKIALNSDAGPVFDDETLAAVMASARGAERRVVAHVEGAGQCSRAIAAFVDVLAHTPFTELISDALMRQAIAQGQQWMSTIDIHASVPVVGAPDGRLPARNSNKENSNVPASANANTTPHPTARAAETTNANLRQFVALGGTVLYGTDLGNGTRPVGINANEVRALQDAGMSVDDVIVAMTAWWGITSSGDSLAADHSRGNERGTFVPGPGVADNFAGSVDFADWLSHARVLNVAELENV